MNSEESHKDILSKLFKLYQSGNIQEKRLKKTYQQVQNQEEILKSTQDQIDYLEDMLKKTQIQIKQQELMIKKIQNQTDHHHELFSKLSEISSSSQLPSTQDQPITPFNILNKLDLDMEKLLKVGFFLYELNNDSNKNETENETD